jgi:CRISPR-associated protein (TIGR02584 family)
MILFVSVIGKSPAVLTETLWEWVLQYPESIPDRILVFTTTTGASYIKKTLFSEQNRWDKFVHDLEKKSNVSLVGKLQFGPIADCIRIIPGKNRSSELLDIKTAEDNQLAAEYFMETLRYYTENPEVRIIASLSGGRKTMSSLLHSTLNLLGRKQDTLTHILVSEPWEQIPEFLYPNNKCFKDPRNGKNISGETAELHLAEIPLFPVRYFLPERLLNGINPYQKFIDQVRECINSDNFYQLEFDILVGVASISGQSLSLSSLEFAFYLVYAERVVKEDFRELTFALVGDEMLHLAEWHEKAHPGNNWSHDIIQNNLNSVEDGRKWAFRIRKALRKLGFSDKDIHILVPHKKSMKISVQPNQIKINP